MSGRRNRALSTSSQSSVTSVYARINQSSPLAEPIEGHTNVYGSFTTTVPASLWLRKLPTIDTSVSLNRRAMRPDLASGYDTPPDSPLSLFHPRADSRRSPSISRTLLTDFDWGGPSTGPVPSPSPSSHDEDNSARLHPALAAVEKRSKLSCRSICSTCLKAGTNFPRCPRCDEMWCSRACRLNGGKKHVCALRKT